MNYQILLENELKNLEGKNKKNLLLHACCAPCSSYCLEYLHSHFNITVLFYNPNIFPQEEYDYRKEELYRLIKEMGLMDVKFISAEYNNGEFLQIAKGLENEPEGGKRCEKCFNLRLEYTAKYAKNNGFDYFTTTLTISPLKNAELLNQIGNIYAEKYNIKFLPSDFKKKNGYKRSIELSKEYNLYRQNYCGCVYSKQNKKALQK